MRQSFALLVIALTALLVTMTLPELDARPKRSNYVFVRGHTFVAANGSVQSPVVFAYEWTKDGELLEVEGSPFAVPSTTQDGEDLPTLTYSKKRRALVTVGADGIDVFSVAKDGTLTLAEQGTVSTDAPLAAIQAVDVGRKSFVFACDRENDRVLRMSLSKDGSLQPLDGDPVVADEGPAAMQVLGKHLVVLSEDAGTINSFRIGKKGTLTPRGAAVTLGTNGTPRLQAGPRRRNVFVGDDASAQLRGYSVSKKTGEIAALPDGPLTTGLASTGSGVSMASKGPSLVVYGTIVGTQQQPVTITKSGKTTLVSDPLNVGPEMAVLHGRSPNSRYLAIADFSGVTSYSVDRETGELTRIGRVSFDGAANSAQSMVVVTR